MTFSEVQSPRRVFSRFRSSPIRPLIPSSSAKFRLRSNDGAAFSPSCWALRVRSEVLLFVRVENRAVPDRRFALPTFDMHIKRSTVHDVHKSFPSCTAFIRALPQDTMTEACRTLLLPLLVPHLISLLHHFLFVDEIE